MPASAQYYYGPSYGAPAYGPPPAPYSYNAPPPVGREYGRSYDDEYAPRGPRPLSARAVVDQLEDAGYEQVGRPRFTGTLYIVQVTGPAGVRQELVVDAIRGVILNRTVVSIPALRSREEDSPPPRASGGRQLDTDDLYRERDEPAPRRAQPRREAARPAPAPAPIEAGPVDPPAQREALPAPADPRLAPTAEPPARVSPRPFEGRSGPREASTDSRRNAEPKETGARPFGVNPPPAAKPKEAEPKGVQKPVQPKPVAEIRDKPAKPVRVIQGVTPLNTGESRSQLDNLPKLPDAPAATGE